MTATSDAVSTTEFLFAMCDRTVNSDVRMGDFSLVLGIMHVCVHTRMCDRTCLQRLMVEIYKTINRLNPAYMWEFFIKKMSPTIFIVMNYVRSLP